MWEEYRNDPLGTRTDAGLCDVDPWTCTGSITRFVWAGDQILWELKAPGNAGANLEAITGSGNAYGQVSYTHAGGIDRPLVITKNGVSVIPHQNWRGMFALATNPTGGLDVPDVDWPGYHTTPWHGPTRVVENWFGSLSTGMRDASGQMYMRNRYYDPASGQFTQPDPIGLAGGLNSYGFAAGDPVTYSDPYGLKADDCDPPGTCPIKGVAAGAAIGGALGVVVAGGCTVGSGGVCALGAPGIVSFFSAGGAAVGGLLGTLSEALGGEDNESGSSGSRSGPTPEGILMPGGSPVGSAGSRPDIREVPGGVGEAEEMFGELSRGGTVVPGNYPGTRVALPGGGTVGIRTKMTNSPGTAANIDVNIPGIPITKIKFNP